ncbi:ATP-binding protein [Larkinella bovis]|uniref:histidine kinase n=1 Tax=Larkinella bovis TaxID=683041 RepID=A0ABW0IIC4_9BACT
MVYDATHGLFWFMGPNVLFAWHPREGIVFNLASTGFPIASLAKLNHLFVDKTGAVWISTQNGFLLLTLERNQFNRLLYSPENDVNPLKFSTRGILKVGNWLWVNSYNGVRLIELGTGKTHNLQNLVRYDYVPVILGNDNKIWTASGDTLAQIDLQTRIARKFSLDKAHGNCWALWQDKRHNFWLGYDEGIGFFDAQKQQVQPFTRYNHYPELAQNRIHGFFPDPKTGHIWVAATSGLYLLDTVRGIIARYSTKDAAPNDLPLDNISFVHFDRTQPGIFWLTSRIGGLIRWERDTGKWQHFSQENGLSNDALYSVHEDRHGHLWLPSNYGLMRFNKYTHQVQVYLPKDGIAHEEFNLTSNYQSNDGQLFLGGLNGITTFWPDKQLTEKPVIVPLMLTHYEQLNANTGERIDYLPDFDQTKQIRIPPQNRSFSLSFSLLDYRYGRQFRLSYRIVGWQDYWTSKLQRDISINGLPPGTYQLEVRAQNPNGQWVSKTLTIPITVLKPFYLQNWFLLLLLLLVAGAIWGIFWWRNKQLIRETKRLEEEVSRRTTQIEKDKAVIEQQAADLQASATLKDRFFANVSHEFRTPLTLLLGPLTYLSKQLSDPALLRLLSSMDRNARQLLTMVSDLLDLSKLDENGIQVVKRPANLAQLINQTVAMFHSQAEYTGLRLTVEGTNKPLWLLMDASKVETVLKNLLANALRFTPSGGAVTVRLQTSEDKVRVDVMDTGPGIHPNDLPHIFERYYQSQQPDAPLHGGTGIGLALSLDYCRLWEGTLTVDSEPGKGSTFSFTHPYQPAQSIQPRQPILTEPAETPTTISKDLESSVNQKVARILFVEDNVDMVTYLETILTPFYQLHVTHNGREAWEWLGSLPDPELPQMIVTDLMMPDMDGMALVDQLQQHPTFRTIPVLMLTARNSRDVKLQALRLGVADYMNKPFDQDELVIRIHNLLERSQERAVWEQQLPPETAPTAPPSAEDEWLLQIAQIIQKNLANRSFQVNTLADAINSSERQLYRQLKKRTGFSPHQFIQEVRLQSARESLENQRYTTVKEVCYAVGFQDVVYFSRLFFQRFGKYPTAFLRNSAKTTDTQATLPLFYQADSENLQTGPDKPPPATADADRR